MYLEPCPIHPCAGRVKLSRRGRKGKGVDGGEFPSPDLLVVTTTSCMLVSVVIKTSGF